MPIVVTYTCTLRKILYRDELLHYFLYMYIALIMTIKPRSTIYGMLTEPTAKLFFIEIALFKLNITLFKQCKIFPMKYPCKHVIFYNPSVANCGDFLTISRKMTFLNQ